jgi:hypothetical protein
MRWLGILSLVCMALSGGVVGLRLLALGDGLFAVGLGATQLGIALFGAFTWRVFRPDATWATLLLLVLAAALGAEWLGLLQASARGDTM